MQFDAAAPSGSKAGRNDKQVQQTSDCNAFKGSGSGTGTGTGTGTTSCQQAEKKRKLPYPVSRCCSGSRGPIGRDVWTFWCSEPGRETPKLAFRAASGEQREEEQGRS